MQHLTKFRINIPDGMTVYEHGVEIADARWRQARAKRFVKRRKRHIYLQPETHGRHDSPAIRVMGRSRGLFFEHRRCLGYLPDTVARKLLTVGLEDQVSARLQLIIIEDTGPVHIRLDLLGPADQYDRYTGWAHGAAVVNPASQTQAG